MKDERPDPYADAYDMRRGRVRPAMSGKSLALPPFAPIVGVLGLALGLLVGFGLAPASAPQPSPASTAIVLPSPSSVPSPGPSHETAIDLRTFELPPAGGLSMAQALKALDAIRIVPVAPDAVSVQAARWPDVWTTPSPPADVWVWAITIRTESAFWCGPAPASESLGPPANQSPNPVCLRQTTEMFVLDYFTGDFLEAMSPASP
jgi:hypothetical protein